MVHIDVPRVRGKMAERGYNLTLMSNYLGISRGTLHTYLKMPEKTPYGVVAELAAALCDNGQEAAAIFFAPNLRKT